VETFRASYNAIDCFEVTQLDWKNAPASDMLKFFLKGGPIRCFSMTASFARAARDEIDVAFADGKPEAPTPPVSCTVLLAQKMGASDMHTSMAAGLAGGIGLSGGACGALGTAIWLIELDNARNNAGKVEYNSPGAAEAIDRFLQSTDFEFECSKIVGRQFEDVGDHAAYLSGGGCAALIEALAATRDQV
jgi:hypothetical protein